MFPTRRNLERQRARIHIVVRTIRQGCLKVDGREASENAAVEHRVQTFFNAWDIFLRYRTAHHLAFEHKTRTRLQRLELDPDFRELAGAARDQQQLFREMTIALVSGVMLMYLVLVVQFGSFTAPIAVMVSLPLSLIGVVLALLATKGTLNLMSFIGVIMLMGLVAKNAILLLDAARAMEAEGMDREEALMAAGKKRLRPIMMTSFALIAGMAPMAVGVGEGGEFYRPMAVAIIGGVITGTLLTLLVIPSFYDSIENARDRAVAKFRRREQRWNTALAFITTMGEALLTLVFVRLVWRLLSRLVRAVLGLGGGAQPA